MGKTLNIKNMKETLVNYSSGRQKEMDRIWKALYTMYQCGYITYSTWKDFFSQCRSWYMNEEKNCIQDENGEIIWQYEKDKYYRA